MLRWQRTHGNGGDHRRGRGILLKIIDHAGICCPALRCLCDRANCWPKPLVGRFGGLISKMSFCIGGRGSVYSVNGLNSRANRGIFRHALMGKQGIQGEPNRHPRLG